MKTVSEDLARELVDFAPTRATREMGFGESQLHGAVAAHNMLARNRVAYLADEVGMGKTYVALGVLGLLRHLDPLARVMVIAPRENIQRKWVKELTNFVRINWKIEDNRVKGMDGRPARGATVCHSLVELADVERLNDDNDLFLRSTSFSASVRDSDAQNRLRRPLLRRIPWIPRHRLRIGHPLEFRDRYGRALNAIFPDIDLLIVDEAHGLKHGFDRRGSNRNRVMGIALGHPVGDDGECSWYRPRVSRVLLLSATPFEYDYRDVYNQLDVLGMGNARLTDADGSDPLEVSRLADPEVDEEEKREVLGRMLVRRVGYLKIGDRRYSKNMYRREWRAGGYRAPIEPMRLTDARERLVVGLVQKKVAELLGDRRFNNSFQIGMLSSFESFLETVGRQRARAAAGNGDDPESGVRHFEGEQEANAIERRGIDTDSLASIARSYREAFGRPLPHPKLDATARALASVFGTGDKALVFVRRVATVGELKSKLDRVFDDWLERKMRVALPELDAEVAGLFRRYRQGNEVEPGTPEGDSSHGDVDQEDEEILEAVVDDEGGEDTFFAWFFRGEGPDGVLSGGSFQKNRLSSMASVYSTIFEDDYVSWLLGRPGDPIDGLAEAVGMDRESLEPKLRADAFRYFRARSRQQSGYPRFYVVEAYQVVGLRLLHDCGGDLGHRAGIVLHERFPPVTEVDGPVPGGFPGPAVGIGISTFFTELVKRDVLRRQIWPEDAAADFGERLRGRERRRELLSAMARLGAGAFPISRSSAVCRQRWTVRLGEVEPVFGQTGRVVLDITARTAHDGALKWTRAPSTPRAARSILATFPSTCALPSGGRWSLRRVLQRPGRQRKRSSAKSSCGPSRTSSSAPSSPPCCNARCARPRLATRRAPSCATCPGGCGATAWRPSTFAPPGARRCRSRRRTTARNTPVGRSGGRDSTPPWWCWASTTGARRSWPRMQAARSPCTAR